MREILTDIQQWFREGKKVVLVTVIETWGSSPRKAGAHMAINSAGEFVGSVSGGCIESAVIQESHEVFEEGETKLLHYGVSDERAWDVGLACGGEIKVLLCLINYKVVDQISNLLDSNTPFKYSIIIEGPSSKLGQVEIQKTLSEGLSYPCVEEEMISKKIITKFVNISFPAPLLIIVGGVHIAIQLAKIAKILEYKTVVIDPRRSFSDRKRFPEIDCLITSWPKEALATLPLNNSSAVVVLTHDPKIDDPALLAALSSPAFYIGVLGSKKTQQKRNERLRGFGCSDEQLERIRSPIGLDIGGKLPSEIALAIMAEIVAVRVGYG